MQVSKAMASLCICADLPEPWMLIKISYTGIFLYSRMYKTLHKKQMSMTRKCHKHRSTHGTMRKAGTQIMKSNKLFHSHQDDCKNRKGT